MLGRKGVVAGGAALPLANCVMLEWNWHCPRLACKVAVVPISGGVKGTVRMAALKDELEGIKERPTTDIVGCAANFSL